ncbi:hypothetical protein Tco_0857273 [Tanacetum coccineum]|uniref:Uncharacterized protein n=1 Tax=Tanacetum coccineum TaxID=301880 RepID=A0ABQ5B9R1_9ASTR
MLAGMHSLGISMTHPTGLSAAAAASHIERELQMTPWNFVASINQGLKVRQLPSQAQVENEDEAAEAAELCRMLWRQLNHNFKNKEKLKAINTGVKPMFSIAQPDGSFSINENAVRSTKDGQEHLAALGDKLGSSLTDTDGPEVQALTKEEPDCVSTTVPPVASSSLFVDDNYHEDQPQKGPTTNHVSIRFKDLHNPLLLLSLQLYLSSSVVQWFLKGNALGALQTQNWEPDVMEMETHKFNTVILEIKEPLKKAAKTQQQFSVPKEKYKVMDVSDIVDDDKEAFFKGSTQGFPYMRHGRAFQDEEVEFPKSADVDDDEIVLKVIPLRDRTWTDRIVWDPEQSVPMPNLLLLHLQDEQMLFEVLDNKDGEHLQLHAGAMITTPATDSAGGDLIGATWLWRSPNHSFGYARESFACGACGQFGRMKVNYSFGFRHQTTQQKNTVKKLIQKSGTGLAVVEAPPKEERSSLKAKILKIRCGPTSSIIGFPKTSNFRYQNTVDRSSLTVNKFKKSRTQDIQVESHKPSSLVTHTTTR